MKLENWKFLDCWGNEVCFGNVYGNPKFTDGQFIRTSKVTLKDLENKIITSLNSTYELGKEDTNE